MIFVVRMFAYVAAAVRERGAVCPANLPALHDEHLVHLCRHSL